MLSNLVGISTENNVHPCRKPELEWQKTHYTSAQAAEAGLEEAELISLSLQKERILRAKKILPALAALKSKNILRVF